MLIHPGAAHQVVKSVGTGKPHRKIRIIVRAINTISGEVRVQSRKRISGREKKFWIEPALAEGMDAEEIRVHFIALGDKSIVGFARIHSDIPGIILGGYFVTQAKTEVGVAERVFYIAFENVPRFIDIEED